MTPSSLKVAIITEVFHDPAGPTRLAERLGEARRQGAELALLPELPLDPWFPGNRTRRAYDSEPPDGRRHRALAAAAQAADLALLGGALIEDPHSGLRHNTSLLFAPSGALAGAYRKAHLPEEEGFWEASHYEPGDDPPEVMHLLAMPLGVQVCSDANRPQGTHLLAALGAELVVVPRATPADTYQRWRLVLRANAVTSACYVISINRPVEQGSPTGGPSLVVAPDGEVVHEGTEPLAVIALDGQLVSRARADYPGYLKVRADLYSRGWRQLGG